MRWLRRVPSCLAAVSVALVTLAHAEERRLHGTVVDVDPAAGRITMRVMLPGAGFFDTRVEIEDGTRLRQGRLVLELGAVRVGDPVTIGMEREDGHSVARWISVDDYRAPVSLEVVGGPGDRAAYEAEVFAILETLADAVEDLERSAFSAGARARGRLESARLQFDLLSAAESDESYHAVRGKLEAALAELASRLSEEPP